MVTVPPPLPGQVPRTVPVVRERKQRVNVYDVVEGLSAERRVELLLWLIERGVVGDPVKNALATVNALHEHELLDFMQQLRKTMHSDLWEVLTGEE